MPVRHVLLAMAVAVMWGLNFIAIDASLQHFPPMFLVALRFALIAVPTVLLIKRPDVPLRWLIGYGLGFGTVQFLFLYWGMAAGMPAGLASLVLQASGPFTMLLGATVLRERVSGPQLIGVLVAVGGLAVVGWQRAEHASVVPFLLTLAGALGWAMGNICNRQARAGNPLHLTLWMSVVPPLPMLALAMLVEGPSRIGDSLTGFGDPGAVGAVVGLAYTVVIGTILGSGLWTWLMSKHPAGVVAPFSMLVPVTGMTAAWLILGETVTRAEALGGVLVVGGVLLGSLRKRAKPKQEETVPQATVENDVESDVESDRAAVA
ncbi:EamA family transporter [Glycomyces algeriensis]|uniref:Membrane protein n=1 Tax=Glycomyces algeriensis TaxID=256037 RepID=A0A9W6G5H3_9ACTN|nr:EamA family transporter [Glycomyces algeriensis]MDA1367595.1 EamA family transporter [Glycomyces algeriensis]MDR7353042.1 O-acetylserine/cysteine efflux transporter [Glycomyces algeriensis]GLI40732.1 membrane protein [Glycomyces algeriensis]